MSNIVAVCTANVCRSPFAEVRLGQAMAGAGWLNELTVASAGIQARTDQPVCRVVMMRLKDDAPVMHSDLVSRRSRRLSTAMIDQADLILTATREQRSAVAIASPEARSRTFTLIEAVLLAEHLAAADRSPHPWPRSSAARLIALVQALNKARGSITIPSAERSVLPWQRGKRAGNDGLDIADGHHGSHRQHNRTLDLVDGAVQDLREAVDAIFSAAPQVPESPQYRVK